MGLLSKETFVCLDCEATGLDPTQERAVEIACVKFTFDGMIDSWESLIDPEIEIPENVIAIHHITQEMVEGKPKAKDVLEEVLRFVGSHTIVGHGIFYDLQLIQAEADRNNIPCSIIKQPYFDTLRLARLYGGSAVNSLVELSKHFNVELGGAHRAMNDVVANVEVFKRLVEKFKTTKQVKEVLSKPIRLKTMPLGKHKGRAIKDVPDQYLRWMANKDFDQDLLYSVRTELKKRQKGNLFSQQSNPFHGL
jgi:DNA polymerase-3 subunit epsilon